MSEKLGRAGLRRRAEELLNELEMCQRLVCHFTSQAISALARNQAAVARATKAELQVGIAELKKEVDSYKRRFGIDLDNLEARGLIAVLRKKHGDQRALLPKSVVISFAPGLEKESPAVAELPNHGCISYGSEKVVGDRISMETWVAESAMFEDMASLFNMAFDAESTKKSSPALFKGAIALRRTVIVHAWVFCESYLNGLAADYLFERFNDLDQISPEVRTKLCEFDYAEGRPRPLTLREKVLSYPRILRGLAHPPIQESNSDSLKILLQTVKPHRDAIIHATHVPDLNDFSPDRVQRLLSVEMDLVTDAVDAAIGLVAQIQAVVYPRVPRMSWLKSRGVDGRFPDDTFH